VNALQKQASTLTGPARAAVLAHIASIKADEAGLLQAGEGDGQDEVRSVGDGGVAEAVRWAGGRVRQDVGWCG
jgi:hypothetical protein